MCSDKMRESNLSEGNLTIRFANVSPFDAASRVETNTLCTHIQPSFQGPNGNQCLLAKERERRPGMSYINLHIPGHYLSMLLHNHVGPLIDWCRILVHR